MIGRLREAGVERILTVGLDEVSTGSRSPFASSSTGCSRRSEASNDADGFDDAAAADLEQLAAHRRWWQSASSGSTSSGTRPSPTASSFFIKQADIAARLDLPLVITLPGSVKAGMTRSRDLRDARGGSGPDRDSTASPPGLGRAGAERATGTARLPAASPTANGDLRTAAAGVPGRPDHGRDDAVLTPQSRRRDRNQPGRGRDLRNWSPGCGGIRLRRTGRTGHRQRSLRLRMVKLGQELPLPT